MPRSAAPCEKGASASRTKKYPEKIQIRLEIDTTFLTGVNDESPSYRCTSPVQRENAERAQRACSVKIRRQKAEVSRRDDPEKSVRNLLCAVFGLILSAI